MGHADSIIRLPVLDNYLREQSDLTAVERFSRHHDKAALDESAKEYRELMPLSLPQEGEQYSFHVDLDRCTGCKACVTACHSLNGLDENETWRFVGMLHGGNAQAPNQAHGRYSTVPGGLQNVASGDFSVAMGQLAQAGGDYSFAAGRRATVRSDFQAGDGDGDRGTFAWADGQDQALVSSGDDQFLVRAQGGVWFGTGSVAPVAIDAGTFIATSTGAMRKSGTYCVANSAQNRSSCTSPRSAQRMCHLALLNAGSCFRNLRG